MDLWHELEAKLRQLGEAVKRLLQTGTDWANAECEYKIALAQESLKLKDEGMPSTLINLVVYGQHDVAMARCKRDIAEVTYKVNQELINQCKIEAKILESQLSREWSVRE